jgi:hypothetical protein
VIKMALHRMGKFELTNGDEEENSSWPGGQQEEESGVLQLRWSDIHEPRLLTA